MIRQDPDQTPLIISSTRNPLVKRIRGLRHWISFHLSPC